MKDAVTHVRQGGHETGRPTPIVEAIARLSSLADGAAARDGTVDAGDLFDAVPSPDTVRPEEYQACVAALGEAGAELFSPASDYAPITTHDPVNEAREMAPEYGAEPGASVSAARISIAHPVLAEETGANDSLRVYLQDTSRFPLLTPEEEIEMAKRIELGDCAARNRMVESNTRLVVSCVFRRARPRAVSVLDLIQEGNLGLITAAEKFDWRLGYRFSTYAIWWIQRKILDALPREGRVIRLPLHTSGQLWHVHQVQAELTQALGREPTEQELVAELTRRAEPEVARRLAQTKGRAPTDEELQIAMRRRRDYQESRLRQLLEASADPLSLHEALSANGDDDGRCLADTEPDPSSPPPDDILMADQAEDAKDDLYRRIQALLYTWLDKPERRVIMHRYGFTKKGPRTQEQTARALGLTTEQVRILEHRALRRLREPWITTSLRGDIIAAGFTWRGQSGKRRVDHPSSTCGDTTSRSESPTPPSETALPVATSRQGMARAPQRRDVESHPASYRA